MNLDDDYDNDGNNIVPCPICLSNYCPSKEDGKCPGEDMFALEGEIRLLLGEYKATDDNSRIVNLLGAVEHLLTTKDQEKETAVALEKAYVNAYAEFVDEMSVNTPFEVAFESLNKKLSDIIALTSQESTHEEKT